jgi:hypothetical protein
MKARDADAVTESPEADNISTTDLHGKIKHRADY